MSGIFNSFRQQLSGLELGRTSSGVVGDNNNDNNNNNNDYNNDNNNNTNFQDEHDNDNDDSASQDSGSWTEELSVYCPTLTWKERLIGFSCAFGLGYLIAFFSFRFFLKLIHGNPIPFACNYTVGHILQLLSSMFLCGPRRQFRNMFDAKRYMTSMVYLNCLAITLILIFIPMPHGLKLFLLLTLTVFQFMASVWYTLSYIPYGRRTVLKILKKMMGIQGDYSIANVLS